MKCNQHIKFTPLLERARAIGADVLVTGHYAQIRAHGGDVGLWRGVDAGKDQSYFLFSMPAAELASVRFPLGGMTKDEVRAHALRLGLPNASKPESQEICFVPDGDYAGFVSAQALRKGRAVPGAGAIVDEAGAVLGRHEGDPPVHRRPAPRPRQPDARRTGSTSPGSTPCAREVQVGPRAAAERTELAIRELRWLATPRASFEAAVQVRHRGTPIAARGHDRRRPARRVRLAEPTVAASGQAAVIYDGDRVLAGGWLAR